MEFLSKQHENQFASLLAKGKISPKDVERMSLMYIIAGNEGLYGKVNMIYDFIENMILFNYDEEKDETSISSVFSSSEQALIRLGFNLYNSYADKETTPIDVFCSLDENNFTLALNALKIRFFGL